MEEGEGGGVGTFVPMGQLSFLLNNRADEISRPSIIPRNSTAVGCFSDENCGKCVSRSTRRDATSRSCVSRLEIFRLFDDAYHRMKIRIAECEHSSAADQKRRERIDRACHPQRLRLSSMSLPSPLPSLSSSSSSSSLLAENPARLRNDFHFHSLFPDAFRKSFARWESLLVIDKLGDESK